MVVSITIQNGGTTKTGIWMGGMRQSVEFTEGVSRCWAGPPVELWQHLDNQQHWVGLFGTEHNPDRHKVLLIIGLQSVGQRNRQHPEKLI